MQLRKIILLCILFFLSSCGSGGDSSRPDERKTGTISGVVFYSAAVNEGAKVTVSELKDNGLLGRTLGTAVTNARGEYSVEVKTASMPLHIVATGGTYKDHFTPENGVNQSQDGYELKSQAYINFTEGEDRSLMLTPLSNMASGLIEYRIYEGKSGIKEIINNSFSDVNAVYGFDVASVRPVDITRGIHSDHATMGHQYGALLRAYSSYAYEQLMASSADKDNQYTYTAYNLFNIQYRDIKSTEMLDGRELNDNGLETGISFGGVTVTNDIYTHEIAQHLLRVVYDPTINKSKIPGKGFELLAEKINNSSDNNVFPMRKIESLDSKAPLVTRHGSKTLVGEDDISLQVDDYIGIQSIDVELQYNNEAGWSELIACNVEEQPSDFCSVTEEIEPGIRNIDNYSVKINTKALDGVDATEVKLVVVTTDVIGNTNVDIPKEIAFKWNNTAPVITVDSPPSFNPNNKIDYVLKGTVKAIEFDLSSFGIQMGAGDLDNTIKCSPLNNPDPMVRECEFSKTYGFGDFNNGTTIFRIEAESENEQSTVFEHSVYTNTTKPIKEIYFPDVAVRFITQEEGGERLKSEGVLSATTFEDVSEDTQKWLNIESQYARQSLKELLPTLDFSKFTPQNIPEYVPYIKVTVSDESGNQEAERLRLIVDYEATKEGSATKLSGRVISTARDCAESERVCLATANKIPHENTADLDGKRIDYYIPFTRDIFGSDFQKVTEGHTQIIRIQVEDDSGNVSTTETYEFKSTFDLPVITLHTPFIGAKANFYRLGDSLNNIGTCITGSVSGALDLARCELNSQYTNEVIKVSLSGKADFDQWSKHESVDITFDSDTKMTGYFFLDGSKDVYLTELSVFQSGFFDYLWNNASSKSRAFAKETLEAVNNLFKDPGFFGFNPILTRYATNIDLNNQIPSQPGSEFQHRFLLEGMNLIIKNGSLLNSLDLANKFYLDFKADGKPDGIGKDNEVIYFDGEALTAKTYRAELAKHYYDFVREHYKDRIADYIIMAFADKYAKADPQLNGKALFTDEATSSDETEPEVFLEIVDGKGIHKKGRWFINDAIEIEIRIKDPSGIDNDKTKIMFSWINDKGESNPVNVISTESEGSTKFDKRYRIPFDPNSAAYPEIAKLDVAVQAVDVHGNDWGLTTPFEATFTVDKDAPVYEYIAPFGDAASDTYINLNAEQELKFKVSDDVGENADVRKLILKKGTEEVIFDIADMSTRGEFIILTLCKKTVCGEDSSELKDGEWLLYVEGEDQLGNKLSINNPNITPFQVNIDSNAPIVNASDKLALLGGNQSWLASQVINYGGGSAAGPMTIKFFSGNGSGEPLEKCDDLEQCSDKSACLIGENEKTEVKLVAANLENTDEEYRFEISAEDTAFRPNIGTGHFRFKVDKVGPVVTLSEPVIPTVAKDGAYYIVGKDFSINIKKIADASDVVGLSVWQKLESGDKLIKESPLPKDFSNPFQISLVENDTNKIQLEGGTALTLVVKSTDEYGFSGQSNDIPVKLYKEGPSISLTNYSKDDFYAPNYSFNVAVIDQANRPVVNDDVRYWIYTGDAPAAGEEGKRLNAENTISTDLTESFNIKLKAEDIRGNISDDVIFPVQVNSIAPQGTLSMEYESSGEAILNNQFISKTGNVRLKLKIDGSGDLSGVSEVKAKLALTEGDFERTFNFAQKNKDWEAVLSEDDIKSDGKYKLTVDIFNKTKTNNGVEKQHKSSTNTLTVQREGYHLKVIEPQGFANYIANDTLKVKFAVEGYDKVKLSKFECWIRDDYNEEKEPQDHEYYASQTNTYEPICDLEGIIKKNFKQPTIITKTTRNNGADVVDKFTFRLVDIDTPVIQHKENYPFTKYSVDYDNGVKKLILNITVTDDLSGIDRDKNPKPTLKKGLKEFSAESESSSSDNKVVTYTFNENYDDLIRKNDSEHHVELVGISDLGGNIISAEMDKKIMLNIPNQAPKIEITGLTDGQFIYSSTAAINFGLRMQLDAVSKVDDISVKLHNTEYTLKTHPMNFEQFKPCGTKDDPWTCTNLKNLPIPAELVNNKLPITVNVNDYWGNNVQSELVLNTVEKAPVISDNYTIENESDNLVVRFDIRPNMSGLSTVKYIVRRLGDDYEVEKTENFNRLVIDASKVQNGGKFFIEVQATDNAELHATKVFTLDITKPKVELSLENTKIVNGVLVLSDNTQDFTLTGVTNVNSVVHLESYQLLLEPTSEGINKIDSTGKVSDNLVSRQINFIDSHQGQYQLKLTVTDHIGREITDFSIDGKEYDGSGVPVIVDFNQPEILGITSTQTGTIPNERGFYPLDVSVSVRDPNLDFDKVNVILKNEHGVVNPSKVTHSEQDSEEYVFSFDALPGEYSIKVTASDLAGKPSEKLSNTRVVASSTPELKITKDADKLGSEKTLHLTFEFTEDVKDFEKSDVKIISEKGLLKGSITDWTAPDGNPDGNKGKVWTANYITPKDVDDKITFKVEKDSYKSLNEIPGEGAVTSLDVIGSALSVKVSFADSSSQVIVGQEVPVNFVFNRKVPEFAIGMVAATINNGDSEPVGSIKLKSPDGGQKNWTGTYTVPAEAVGKSLFLTVSGYHDDYANTGITGISPTLTVAPEATINSISGCEGKGTGTGIGSGATCDLTIEFSEPIAAFSKDAILLQGSGRLGTPRPATLVGSSSNNWVVTYTAERGVDDTATVTVLGDELKTALGARVVNDKKTTIKVFGTELTVGVSFTNPPATVVAGQPVAVAFTFNRGVKDFNKDMVKTTINDIKTPADLTDLWSTNDQHNKWTATYTVPENAAGETLSLTVAGYSDDYGNTGKVGSSPTLTVAPEASINRIMGCGGIGIGSGATCDLTIEFSEQVAEFSLDALQLHSETGLQGIGSLGTPKANSDNSWTVTYTAATGINKSVTVKILSDKLKTALGANVVGDKEASINVVGSALTVDMKFVGDPVTVVAGQLLPITFDFNRAVPDFAVNMITVKVGDKVVSFGDIGLTPTDGQTQHWTATYTVPADAAGKTLSLTVAGYSDEYSNVGTEGSSPTLTVAPEAIINSISGCGGIGIGSGATCDLTIEFSEQVAEFSLDALQLQSETGLQDIGSLGTPKVNSDNSWTVTYTAATGINKSVTVKILSDKLKTALGAKVVGDKEASINVVGSALTVDAKFVGDPVTVVAGQLLPITFDFNRAVPDFDFSMVTVRVGDKVVSIGDIGLTHTDGQTQHWTATYTVPVSAAGETLSLTVAGYSDEYNNAGTAGSSPTLTVAPEATINRISGCERIGIGSGASCELTIEFSEPVAEFSQDTLQLLSVTGLQDIGSLGIPKANSDNSWTVTYTAATGINKSVTVKILSDKLKTALGAKVVGDKEACINVVGSPLTVDTKFVGDPATVVAGQVLPITFDFNRAVPDFAANMITARVGDKVVSLGDIGLAHTDGQTQHWTATYTVPTDAAGETLSLTVAGYIDEYSNAGTEGSSPTLTVAPEGEIESITLCDDIVRNGSIGSGATCDLTIKFSQPVSQPSQAAIFIKAGSGTLGTPTPGADNSWKVSYTAATGKDETATIQVLGDELKTKQGARVIGDKAVDISVIGSAPTVSINFENRPWNVTVGDEITVTFEFSRSVPTFDADMVTVKEEFESYGRQALLTGLASTDLQQKIWTATYTVPDGAEGKNLRLTAEGYKDKYGNTGTAGSSDSLTISG